MTRRGETSGTKDRFTWPLRLGKYEIGRTLGQNPAGKVKLARNVETGELFSVKIFDKLGLHKLKILESVQNELKTLRLIEDPNFLKLYEVSETATKIYVFSEYLTGGDLSDKLEACGRLDEDEARKYFRQLITAVDYCNRMGLRLRSLKLQNLFLGSNGVLKLCDVGISSIPQRTWEDGVIHEMAHGTANYNAPEVIRMIRYEWSKADVWSCGVILFQLLAGYAPFNGENLEQLTRQICEADCIYPSWFSPSVTNLIKMMLAADPNIRTTFSEIYSHDWYWKGYRWRPNDSHEEYVGAPNLADRIEKKALLNSCEPFNCSRGRNLRTFFQRHLHLAITETRYELNLPANEIIPKIEEVAKTLGFVVEKKYKVKLKRVKERYKGRLTIAVEIFEVAPLLNTVKFCRSKGDVHEYQKVCKEIHASLLDKAVQLREQEASGSEKI